MANCESLLAQHTIIYFKENKIIREGVEIRISIVSFLPFNTFTAGRLPASDRDFAEVLIGHQRPVP